MKVALIDYGVGNLHSLAKAIESGGADLSIEDDPLRALSADALVLPGVGAFSPASARLSGAVPALRDAIDNDFPVLGICLGMQLLYEASDEGAGAGIGVFQGRVAKLHATRIPHMGWNGVESSPDPLFRGIGDMFAYYAHSFVAPIGENAIAWTEYQGYRFPAAVRRRNAWGVQFHPEKSADAGLQVIRNFLSQIAA